MRRRARTDLCGGRSAMAVPTATVTPVVPAKSPFDQVHVASTASEPNLAKTIFRELAAEFLGALTYR
jgi:hypothetical protein